MRWHQADKVRRMHRSSWTSLPWFSILLENWIHRNVSLQSWNTPITRPQRQAKLPPSINHSQSHFCAQADCGNWLEKETGCDHCRCHYYSTPTLWEVNVHCIIEGHTYSFTNLVVNTFCNNKKLSAPRKAIITTDNDMTAAATESSDSDTDKPMVLQDVEVIGVLVISSHTTCITCQAKVKLKSANIGCCTTCSMPLRLDKYVQQLSTKSLSRQGRYKRFFKSLDHSLSRWLGNQRTK